MISLNFSLRFWYFLNVLIFYYHTLEVFVRFIPLKMEVHIELILEKVELMIEILIMSYFIEVLNECFCFLDHVIQILRRSTWCIISKIIILMFILIIYPSIIFRTCKHSDFTLLKCFFIFGIQITFVDFECISFCGLVSFLSSHILNFSIISSSHFLILLNSFYCLIDIRN